MHWMWVEGPIGPDLSRMTSRMGRAPSTYVALLRGVNVGGHGKVPMAELRELLSGLGFGDVRSYIQSGNVVFASSSTPDPVALKAAISTRFAVAPDVVVRSAESLQRVVANNPFDLGQESNVHVGFSARSIARGVVDALDLDRFLPERCEVLGSEIFLSLPNGMGQAKLPSYLERRVNSPVTYRNWATVKRLVEMASTSPLGDRAPN